MKIIGFFLAVCFAPLISINSEEIKWVKDLNKGLAEAKSSGKPAMIDVYTDWCYWCKELDNKTYKDASVVSLSKSFINIKVNPEKDKTTAEFIKKFEISGFPAILFVEHTGDLIFKIDGFLAGKEFLAKMKDVEKTRGELVSFGKEYSKGDFTNTPDYLIKLIESRRFDTAAAIFDKVKDDKTIKKDKLGDVYLQIGIHYMEKEDYKKAVTYFIDAEKYYTNTRTGIGASYYHAYCEYNLGNSANAVSILTKVLKNPMLPPEWKAQFESAQKAFAVKKK
jgi:thioredoxin-related protein